MSMPVGMVFEAFSPSFLSSAFAMVRALRGQKASS